MTNPVIHLDVVCYKEDDLFVAHCLQLDLVTTATTVHQACIDLEGIIKAHLQYAIENENLDNIFKPAPQEIWRMMTKATLIEDDSLSEICLGTIPPPHYKFQLQRLCT